jgi:hypothetical protein
MKYRIFGFILSAAMAIVAFSAIPVRADVGPLMGSVDSQCATEGKCELSDALRVGVWVTQWILGIVGSLALLMFIYGGFTWLTSAGNTKAVDKGKAIVMGAATGLVIVFLSYSIVDFSLKKLGYNSPLSGQDWFTVPK